jgi:DMSO/TMAO reductase YedYZ molybdopterin-dependent catalytic subunit
VPLAELARLAGHDPESEAFVSSLQSGGSFSSVTLAPAQVANAQSLLALRVNGADISLDHGFPARVIVPAAPGVHCTKWVKSIRFSRPA